MIAGVGPTQQITMLRTIRAHRHRITTNRPAGSLFHIDTIAQYSIMGSATSRFGDTDWNTVGGGLTQASHTIDGAEPTKAHSILTLKKQTLVNQRAFEIRNDVDELLYTSQPIEGTTKWFDFFNKSGVKLFCIQTNADRSFWNVYSYQPVWPGQAVDDEATRSIPNGTPLYRKGRIDISWNKHHGEYIPIIPSPEEDPMGVPATTEEPLLRVEEIKSITGQYQSYVPQDALLDNALHPPLAGWWVWGECYWYSCS